jgi:hypothetical protein
MRSRTGEYAYAQSDRNVQNQFLDHATVQSPGTGQLSTEQSLPPTSVTANGEYLSIQDPLDPFPSPPRQNAVNNRASTSSSSFQQQRSPASASGLAPSVLRTVISSGNDALNILFEAASHDATNPTSTPPVETHASHDTPGTASLRSYHDALPQPIDFPPPSAELLRLWGACRFVTMGWVTAKDAILYIDLYASFNSSLHTLTFTDKLLIPSDSSGTWHHCRLS